MIRPRARRTASTAPSAGRFGPGALQPAAEERGEDGAAPGVRGCVLDARAQRAPVLAEEVLERAPTVGEAVRVVVEHAAEGGGPEADRDGPELRGR